MKTITLSLTDAFRLRNLLKTAISENRRTLLSTSLFYNPETQMKDHNTFVTKYESLPKLLDLLLEEKSTLGNLNTAIDKANVEIRPYLNEVETIKNKLDVLQRLDMKIDEASDVNVEFLNNEKVITRLTAEYDEEFVSQLSNRIKKAKKEILNLESKISELNGTTKLTISIEEDVYVDIYNA